MQSGSAHSSNMPHMVQSFEKQVIELQAWIDLRAADTPRMSIHPPPSNLIF
jgi:hypothetical protein